MNVLVLHRMGDPRHRREAVRTLEYMIPECRPDLNCIVHDTDLPFPEYLQDIDYHLIVLGPTFLCNRYNQSRLSDVLKLYSFIRESQACKLALPQDDYDCSGILDEWMVNWKVDRIYTVCPDHWNLLYPKASKSAQVKLGYTGYISESWIDFWCSPKPHNQRNIDVSYRTHNGSINRCYLRNLKYVIADNFRHAIANHTNNLVTDISNDIRDLIPGHLWHDFLSDSKFCLTTPSGSSLLDPLGDYHRCTKNYLRNNPSASFKKVKEHCFPDHDQKYMFTAISPRNLEAALAETVQIATPGSYSGLMRPLEHFIPLDEDCSNVSEVLKMMNDPALITNIQKQCKESILSESRLRRNVIVDEIVSFAESIVTERNISESNQESVIRALKKYNSEIVQISNGFWQRKRIVDNLQAAAVKLGASRAKRLIATLSPRRKRGTYM